MNVSILLKNKGILVMMFRRSAWFILIVMLAAGCTEEASVDDTADAVGIVETIYGVGFDRSAAIGWHSTSTAVDQFGIYRHPTAVFSVTGAVRIGTVPVSSRPGIIDTGLVNGTQYFYTVVPERRNSDGTFITGKGTQRVMLTPFDPSSVPAASIVYSQHVQPLFTSGCAVKGCHADDGHMPLLRKTATVSHLVLSDYDHVISGAENIGVVVPFRASRSHLLRHLNRDTLLMPAATPSMPPGFDLPTPLRDLLIRWIDAGAKNDAGTVPFSALPARGWAYVTNQGEDLTAVIDLDKHRIARYITTGVANTNTAPPQAPHNVAVDRLNQFYYVNLIGGSKLLKFRVSDNTLAGELTSGLNSPAQVALSYNGDTAYVSNFENAKTNISVVNTATMTKIGDVSDPAMLKPHGISMTPDYRYVVVANALSDNLTVVRTSDRSVAATVPMSGSVPALPINYSNKFEPYQSVVTPDSRFVFVTCRKSNEVRVVDLSLMKVIDSISVGSFPLIPAIDPAGKMVFVANRNSNSVTAIDVATRKAVYTVTNVGVEPHGIAVSKDGAFVYVACENLGVSEPPHHATAGGKKPSFLKIIDVAKRSVTGSIELANFGSGMAVTN